MLPPVRANPWAWLYERESQPLKAYVLDRVAEHLAEAVERFPPPIEWWERADLQDRFDPVLEQVRGRPDDRVVRFALKLYRWELERDVERIDRYLAGGHESEFSLGALERETALFLWQYFVDQTLAFKEMAKGKFRQTELLGLADRLDSRLLGHPSIIVPGSAR